MANIFQEIHKTPVLRICIPFIMGVVLHHFFSLPLVGLLFIFVIMFAATFLVYRFVRHYYLRHVFALVLSLFFITAGSLLNALHQANNKPAQLPGHGEFLGYVSSLPQQKKNSVFAEITICSFQDSILDKPVKSWIYFENSIPENYLVPGNWLWLDANLKMPEKNLLPTEFDYYTYLIGQKVFYTAYVPLKKVQNANLQQCKSLKILSLKIKKQVLQIFEENGLGGEELALISALTIGYKKLLPIEQREAYAASGAMHVLAVSGLHVGILFLLFSNIFGFLKKLPFGKELFTLVVILLLFFFAFITGFSPSVTRATLMFSFIAAGKVMRRQQYVMNTIAASALVLLIINPSQLFQVGFQLSYVAVIGIVLFYPVLEQRWKVVGRVSKWMVGLILVSVVAQFVTAPLNMYYFHRFPNYALLSNLVVIPLVTVLLNLTVLLIILGFLNIYFAPLAFLTQWVAKLMNNGVYLISSLPGSTFESIYLSPIENLVLYAIIVCILVYIYFKIKPVIWFSLILLLLFSVQKTVTKFNALHETKWVVFEEFGEVKALIKDPENGIVISLEPSNSTVFCPTWFFKNNVPEEKVWPVTTSDTYQSNRFCLYRNFLGFAHQVVYLKGEKNDDGLMQSLFESASFIIQFNSQSAWQVAENPDENTLSPDSLKGWDYFQTESDVFKRLIE